MDALSSFYFQFLILLNKLVSLYGIFLVCFFGDLLLPMGVVSRVFLFLGMKNCSHWLKFKTQHEGIEISDAVNMVRSITFFPNYIRMIDFLINSDLIQQIQWGVRCITRSGSLKFFRR